MNSNFLYSVNNNSLSIKVTGNPSDQEAAKMFSLVNSSSSGNSDLSGLNEIHFDLSGMNSINLTSLGTIAKAIKLYGNKKVKITASDKTIVDALHSAGLWNKVDLVFSSKDTGNETWKPIPEYKKDFHNIVKDVESSLDPFNLPSFPKL